MVLKPGLHVVVCSAKHRNTMLTCTGSRCEGSVTATRTFSLNLFAPYVVEVRDDRLHHAVSDLSTLAGTSTPRGRRSPHEHLVRRLRQVLVQAHVAGVEVANTGKVRNGVRHEHGVVSAHDGLLACEADVALHRVMPLRAVELPHEVCRLGERGQRFRALSSKHDDPSTALHAHQCSVTWFAIGAALWRYSTHQTWQRLWDFSAPECIQPGD